MINSPSNPIEELFDFEVLPVEAIALEPNWIDQAVQLSSQIANESRQWQTYLNALALFAFEQWLSERDAEIPVNREHCSVLHPQYASAINSVCNLRVGKFKLCLLTIGTLTDEAVTLPRAAIDIPEYTAHFYVVLEVQEEQEQVTIRGFLRHDQLANLRQSANLQADRDWTYELPLSWFNSDPDGLLLYLRCLEPAAIPMPSVPTNRLASLSVMQAELAAKLPQLNPDNPLWQVLTWEQGAAVLTSPDLLDWLYRLQEEQFEGKNIASLSSQLLEVMQRLTQGVVNVGLWLRDELDEFAQSLSWVMLPAPDLATASLRSLSVSTRESPIEELKAIIAGLKATGMEIPFHAGSAYRDLNLAEIPLRLYAVIWSVPSEENIPEWTLLLVLGAQPNAALPHGIKLQVSDQTSVLVERMLEQNTNDTYLYTCVVGNWDEEFRVTITLMDGEALTLPPFAFVP